MIPVLSRRQGRDASSSSPSGRGLQPSLGLLRAARPRSTACTTTPTSLSVIFAFPMTRALVQVRPRPPGTVKRGWPSTSAALLSLPAKGCRALTLRHPRRLVSRRQARSLPRRVHLRHPARDATTGRAAQSSRQRYLLRGLLDRRREPLRMLDPRQLCGCRRDSEGSCCGAPSFLPPSAAGGVPRQHPTSSCSARQLRALPRLRFFNSRRLPYRLPHAFSAAMLSRQD